MRLVEFGASYGHAAGGNGLLESAELAMGAVPLPLMSDFQSPRSAVSPSSTRSSSPTQSTVTSPVSQVCVSIRGLGPSDDGRVEAHAGKDQRAGAMADLASCGQAKNSDFRV
jgi:hypothetical protein